MVGKSESMLTESELIIQEPGLKCHYCGRKFAAINQIREAHDHLVRHLTNDCPDVPIPVRRRYEESHTEGNCNA
jgi:hypothetical protein